MCIHYNCITYSYIFYLDCYYHYFFKDYFILFSCETDLLWIEPTSTVKSARIAQLDIWKTDRNRHSRIVISPDVYEFNELVQCLKGNWHFRYYLPTSAQYVPVEK